MFTGIVAAVGKIAGVRPTPGGVALTVDAGALALDDVVAGDSIAVNGVCLTVTALRQAVFEADVSQETLHCAAGFTEEARVNLEKALRLSDRLGGHLVSGHVDGVGDVRRFEAAGDNRLLRVAAPADIAKYIAHKGSVTINGVSLTVNEIDGVEFTVNLIPHTLQATNLRHVQPGDRVNLEADIMARYVERLLTTSK
ncbi:MAG: riboflavin synthase [Pseudomonadota bacterium]